MLYSEHGGYIVTIKGKDKNVFEQKFRHLPIKQIGKAHSNKLIINNYDKEMVNLEVSQISSLYRESLEGVMRDEG